MKFSLSFASLIAVCGFASAVIEPERLILDGILTSVSCTGNEYNTGGTIKVNGFSITIPENSIWQLPNAWVPFKDICAGGFTGNEVVVYGNIVNGKPIAGIVQMSQLLLMGGTGYIESLDSAKGTIKLLNGPTLRINDPNGVFGVPYTDKPAFTADDESPSIVAFSGFPMCIPRSASDPLCPASNRPSTARTFIANDPLVMVPFKAGDFLEYSGIMDGDLVVCYEIVATNVQVQSSSPVYIRVEEAIIGTFDGDANSEFGDTRIIGYLSDPQASVVVSALEVDPCTGEETKRVVGSAVQRLNDVRNKFIWRADSNTLNNYTREYHVQVNSGTQVTKNNITAGQYVTPVDWIFPEINVPGVDSPKLDFSGMRFLVNGIEQDGKQYGQLKPFPDTTAPATPSTCTKEPDPSPPTDGDATTTYTPFATPTAFAGNDFKHIPGSVVTLGGSNNASDVPESNLTYSWTQVSGPTVTLVGADKAKCSFTAAVQASATPTAKREFKLTISQKNNSTINSTDNIIATGDRSVQDVVTINSYTWTSTQSGTISVTASSNVVADGSAALKLFLGTSTTALTMTHNGNGLYSYGSRSTKQPASIRITSVYGGSASRTALTSKRRRNFSILGEGGMVSRIKRGLLDRSS